MACVQEIEQALAPSIAFGQEQKPVGGALGVEFQKAQGVVVPTLHPQVG